MILKDSKQFVKQATAAVEQFHQTIADNPELLVPLAVVHVVPIALTIAGATSIIVMHQRVRIEKERTKQAKLRAGLNCHHHGPHPDHGPHPMGPHHDHKPSKKNKHKAPKLLADAH